MTLTSTRQSAGLGENTDIFAMHKLNVTWMAGSFDSMRSLLLSHLLSVQTSGENIPRVTLCLDERVAAALAGVAEVAGRAVKIGHASLGCKSMIEKF